MVLMVLEVVLVVLEVVLVVLEVTGPQVPWGIFQIRLSLRPDLYFPAPPIGQTPEKTIRNMKTMPTQVWGRGVCF